MSRTGSLKLPGWESTRGAASRTAKMTDARVIAIRRCGLRTKVIARVFGVSDKTITDILRRKTYRDVV